MPNFDDAIITDLPFHLGVKAKYVEKLANGGQRFPESLLILDKAGNIIGVGDFFSVDECATLEPLDVAREKAAQAFLEGVKKGLSENDGHALSDEEVRQLITGR